MLIAALCLPPVGSGLTDKEFPHISPPFGPLHSPAKHADREKYSSVFWWKMKCECKKVTGGTTLRNMHPSDGNFIQLRLVRWTHATSPLPRVLGSLHSRFRHRKTDTVLRAKCTSATKGIRAALVSIFTLTMDQILVVTNPHRHMGAVPLSSTKHFKLIVPVLQPAALRLVQSRGSYHPCL